MSPRPVSVCKSTLKGLPRRDSLYSGLYDSCVKLCPSSSFWNVARVLFYLLDCTSGKPGNLAAQRSQGSSVLLPLLQCNFRAGGIDCSQTAAGWTAVSWPQSIPPAHHTKSVVPHSILFTFKNSFWSSSEIKRCDDHIAVLKTAIITFICVPKLQKLAMILNK